jgi:hypothetical protein
MKGWRSAAAEPPPPNPELTPAPCGRGSRPVSSRRPSSRTRPQSPDPRSCPGRANRLLPPVRRTRKNRAKARPPCPYSRRAPNPHPLPAPRRKRPRRRARPRSMPPAVTATPTAPLTVMGAKAAPRRPRPNPGRATRAPTKSTIPRRRSITAQRPNRHRRWNRTGTRKLPNRRRALPPKPAVTTKGTATKKAGVTTKGTTATS